MTDSLTPWWEALQLRPEIADAGGDVANVQMSLYKAVHRPDEVPYSDPAYYAQITHPTSGLVQLLAEVAVRVGLGKQVGPRPVRRGDQGMGGGKSHGLVGLWHMTSDPSAFFATELGKRVRAKAADLADGQLPADLASPVVAVLPCDELAPGRREQEVDGPADTLAERWLWRLVEGDNTLYQRYRSQLETKHGVEDAIRSIGRPVLTLVDEVLDYLRTASSDPDDEEYALEVAAFLTRLMEATTNVENASMVVVMISSEVDVVSMNELGEAQRRELEGKMTKYASPVATTHGGDFAHIIRRRLFANTPPKEVIDATARRYRDVVGADGSPWDAVWDDVVPGWADGRWADEVARCYPFHPSLMDMVGTEWAVKTGFQKVRSTLQVFAATVWHHMRAADDGSWVPTLVGVGDLPLDDATTRNALLNAGIVDDPTTVNNYREIAAVDVVTDQRDGGNAYLLDIERTGADAQSNLLDGDDANPHVAERLATAMWVSSLAPRKQGVVGATEKELLVAGFHPDPSVDLPSVEAMLTTLASDRGLATIEVIEGTNQNNPRRYRLSTKQTVKMFFRQQRQAVTDQDIADALRNQTKKLMTSGPFDEQRFIDVPDVDDTTEGSDRIAVLVAALENAGIDEQGKTRLYVLDATAFTLLNGVDVETRRAIWAAFGLDPDRTGLSDDELNQDWETPQPLSVASASSAVFAVVNTQKRRTARGSAADWVAWSRVVALDTVARDERMAAEASDKLADVTGVLRKHLESAFQHVVYLAEIIDDDGQRRRVAKPTKFESAGTALNGTAVWKKLVEEAKAYDQGQFSVAALMLLIDDHGWWGRPLREVRDAFYKTPRVPLLFGGEADLRDALFAAVRQGKVAIADQDGTTAVATSPGQINLSRNDLFLANPNATTSPQGAGPGTGAGSATSTTFEGATTSTLSAGGQASMAAETSPERGGDATSSPGAGGSRVTVRLSAQGIDGQQLSEAEAWYDAMAALSRAFLDGHVGFAKMTLQASCDAETAQEIADTLAQVNIAVNLDEGS